MILFTFFYTSVYPSHRATVQFSVNRSMVPSSFDRGHLNSFRKSFAGNPPGTISHLKILGTKFLSGPYRRGGKSYCLPCLLWLQIKHSLKKSRYLQLIIRADYKEQHSHGDTSLQLLPKPHNVLLEDLLNSD